MAERAAPDGTLPLDEAVDLLHAFRAGTAGDDLIPDPPVIVVDLGTTNSAATGTGAPLCPPTQLPCVVVALDRSGTAPPQGAAPAGADVYVCDAPDAPAPWAGRGDLGPLVAAVRRNPQASTTLVQVLRARTGEVGRDLVTESLAYATLQAGREHTAWLGSNAGRTRADEDGSPAVRVTRSGGTLDVLLDRPERRNAYSARMRDDLVAALELAASDPTITSVVLSGAGPSFSSGGDLAEFGTVDDPATAHRIRMSRNAGYLTHLVAAKLTAFVHGPCVGAGVEIPAFAGRVSVAPGATFRLPEIGMGLIPGAGGTASIPRRIGVPRTAWLALSGSEIDADTAVRWGLADSITEM